MADVPHLDLPFRFARGHAVVVEQDSLDDITNCVEATLRTLLGQRLEIVDFGISNPTFGLQPLDLSTLVNAVLKAEPRASLLMEQAPDRFNSLVANVVARVSTQEVSSNG